MAKRIIWRSFGTPLHWRCLTPRSHWVCDPGWGEFHLRRYNNRGQAEGWYLDTPDEMGDWAGLTLTEAAQDSWRDIIASRPRGES